MITIAAGIILLVCIVLDGIIYWVNYNAKTKCEESSCPIKKWDIISKSK